MGCFHLQLEAIGISTPRAYGHLVVVVLPDPFREMRGPNSRAPPQGLDQGSKMEEAVAKMTRRRGSDAGQARR